MEYDLGSGVHEALVGVCSEFELGLPPLTHSITQVLHGRDPGCISHFGPHMIDYYLRSGRTSKI